MSQAILARNNVRVRGRGTRPMLFAHGFGCDQNMWRLVAPAFEDDHRVVLFDHVGSGKTDPVIARRFAEATFFADNRADLAAVRVPPLVMQCSEDLIAPREVGSSPCRTRGPSTLRRFRVVDARSDRPTPHAMTEADAPPPRRRLPDVSLSPRGGGAAVPLRVPRQATVLVLLGGAPDAAGRAYLRTLADAEPALRGWDGRVLIVVGGDGGDSGTPLAAEETPFPLLADPGASIAAAAGVAAPALVVADQWGEVHVAAPAAAPGAWLPAAEVEKWLRFLAIRCAG